MTYDEYVQGGGDPNAVNDPNSGWFAQNAPPAAAPIKGEPFTQAELAESQNWSNQYYASHQIPNTYGTPDDLANAYVAARRGGSSHAEAMAALQQQPVKLGWDKYQAPAAPGPTPDPTPDPGANTGGGSSGGAAASAPPGTGWQAPAGPPGTGFGSEVPTYTPPVYASNPNAPQYQPLPAYVAPTWTGGDFVNPTMEEVQATPGYQSRLDQLIKTRERQAAAQGTILSGGTLKALDRAGQDYATGEYQTARSNALENYKQRYGQFTDAAGMSLAARTMNANENNQAFQNQTNTYNTGNARTLSDYITNVTGQRTAVQDAASAKRNAELDYWSRLQDLNQTGSNLAGGSYRV